MRPPMNRPDTRGNPFAPENRPDTRGNPRVPMYTNDTRGNPRVPLNQPDTRGNQNVPMNVNDVRGLLALTQGGMQDRNGTGGVMIRNGGDMQNQNQMQSTNPAFYPGFQSLLADQMMTGFGGAKRDYKGILGSMFQPSQQRQPFQITTSDVDGTGGGMLNDGLSAEEQARRDNLAKNEYIIMAKQGRFPTITNNISPEIMAELNRIRNGGK